MPRKKIIGNCKVEGCSRELDSLGFCRVHYMRVRTHGTTELINRRGKTKTSVISVWHERRGYGSLPPEWHNDFWQFYKDVGDRPSKNHYLVKIDRTAPYSKENFKWIEHIKRQPHESDKDWQSRKWKQRINLRPAIKEYGKGFRIFLNCGHFKEHKNPLEEFSRIYLEKLDTQNGNCAICHKPETSKDARYKKTKRLALDHCHKTMNLRDLLCSRCNTTLGRMEESIPLLQNMIEYIKKHTFS